MDQHEGEQRRPEKGRDDQQHALDDETDHVEIGRLKKGAPAEESTAAGAVRFASVGYFNPTPSKLWMPSGSIM
jgi:hypothetical protein